MYIQALACTSKILVWFFKQGGCYGDDVELMKRLTLEESEHPSSNLVNDGVILPSETRQVRSESILTDIYAHHIDSCLTPVCNNVRYCLSVWIFAPTTHNLKVHNLREHC